MRNTDRAGHESPALTADASLSTCPSCDQPITGIATAGPGAHEASPCGCPLGSARVDDLDQEPRVMTDGGQPLPDDPVFPDVIDIVEAPDGKLCQMYSSGEGPERCDAEAEYLIVFDGLLNPDRTMRRNVLACSDCFHHGERHPEVRADGGQPVDDDELPSDVISVTETDYSSARIESGIISASVDSSYDGAPFGLQVHQDGRSIAVTAGTTWQPDDDQHKFHVYQSLSVDQAREVADALQTAADRAEDAEEQAEQEPDSGPDSLLRRLIR